jgi:hypothetical protein
VSHRWLERWRNAVQTSQKSVTRRSPQCRCALGDEERKIARSEREWDMEIWVRTNRAMGVFRDCRGGRRGGRSQMNGGRSFRAFRPTVTIVLYRGTRIDLLVVLKGLRAGGSSIESCATEEHGLGSSRSFARDQSTGTAVESMRYSAVRA